MTIHPVNPTREDLRYHWHTLRGRALVDAQLSARWHVHPNDVIGGWSLMPCDMPPSSGVPEVAGFLSEQAARHIADLHNAALAGVSWIVARDGGRTCCSCDADIRRGEAYEYLPTTDELRHVHCPTPKGTP